MIVADLIEILEAVIGTTITMHIDSTRLEIKLIITKISFKIEIKISRTRQIILTTSIIITTEAEARIMTMIEGHLQEKETRHMTRTMQIAALVPVVGKERIEIQISGNTAISKLKMKEASIINIITKEGISITTIVVVLLATEGVGIMKIVAITAFKVVGTTIVVVTTIRGTSIILTITDVLVIT